MGGHEQLKSELVVMLANDGAATLVTTTSEVMAFGL